MPRAFLAFLNIFAWVMRWPSQGLFGFFEHLRMGDALAFAE